MLTLKQEFTLAEGQGARAIWHDPGRFTPRGDHRSPFHSTGGWQPSPVPLIAGRRASLANRKGWEDDVAVVSLPLGFGEIGEWGHRDYKRLLFVKTLANTLSLVVSENAVALLPDYLTQIPSPGVAVRTIVDAGATWDFLVVWQRGSTPPPMRAFLDALTVPVGKRPHE
jgi:DNA-binding transcriptional LysR family regulator